MKTTIILDEKNPLSEPYIENGHNRGRMRYPDTENLATFEEKTIKGLCISGYQDVLEIGSGHNTIPAKTFSKMGSRVSTLCLESDDFASEAKIEFNNNENKPPVRIGEWKSQSADIQLYVGDVGLVEAEGSHIRDKKFDLVYFWGSLHTGGCNSSIDSKPRDYVNRLVGPVGLLKHGGKIMVIAEYFNHQGDVPFSRDCILRTNENLGMDVLSFAVKTNPTELNVYGLSEDRAKNILDNSDLGIFEDFVKMTGGKDIDGVSRAHILSNLNEKGLELFSFDGKNPFQDVAVIDAFVLTYGKHGWSE